MPIKNCQHLFKSRIIFLIFKEIFYALTAALIVFAGMELAWQGIVSAYININWVLIFWLLGGIVVLASNDLESKL